MIRNTPIPLIFCLFLTAMLNAQILDFNKRVDVVLPQSKLNVVMYAQASSSPNSKSYFYLPCNLRLSVNNDGKPKFLLLNYITDNKVSGAIMHGSIEWGLTKEQEREAERELQRKVPGAKLQGAAFVKAEGAAAEGTGMANFSVVSAYAGEVQTGPVVTMPGAPTPFKANFEDYTKATIFTETVKNKKLPAADLSMYMGFKYFVKVEGIKGTITVDYEKLYKALDSLNQSASWSTKKKWLLFFPYRVKDTYNVQKSKVFLDEINETYGVKITIDDNSAIANLQPELSSKIIEIFTNAAMNRIGAKPEDEFNVGNFRRPTDSLIIPSHEKYSVSSTTLQQLRVKKKETFTLNYNVTVPMVYFTGANLKDWEGVLNSCTDCIPEPLVIKNIDDKIGSFQILLDDDLANTISSGLVTMTSVEYQSQTKSGSNIFTKEGLAPVAFNYVRTTRSVNDPFTIKMKIQPRGGEVMISTPQTNRDGIVAVSLSDFKLAIQDITTSTVSPELLEETGFVKSFIIAEYKLNGKWKRRTFTVKYNEDVQLTLLADSDSKIFTRVLHVNKNSKKNILTERQDFDLQPVVLVDVSEYISEEAIEAAHARFLAQKPSIKPGVIDIPASETSELDRFLQSR